MPGEGMKEGGGGQHTPEAKCMPSKSYRIPPEGTKEGGGGPAHTRG